MIIRLYELFGSHALRQRETAQKVVEMVINEPTSRKVIVDFDQIEFATRSFLNELLSGLYNKDNVEFINTNESIEQMMKISFKPLTCNSEVTA
ncbi:STAS-like domain-containing protein [Methanocella conradii]|uniref:STAS-like domain-containing protein n=1 Tax=Methanocella conradii TaxID=1175444 RepID=UPI00157D3922|nr:STAS-like domain-containing protein [Methanocella conradii]MDI6897422.1 STAS-like domain-containing protein [Methanocella conradii]